MERMRTWIFLSLTVLAAAAWAFCEQMTVGWSAAAGMVPVKAAQGSPLSSNPQAAVPVVVELFTSEGCSSCPPADRLLADLADQPLEGIEIIPLSLHVDYWDRLGWKDPFSSARFSERQRRYGSLLALPNVYTPQMVVQGRREFVGSDSSRALREIKAAAHRANPRIGIEVLESSAAKAQVAVRMDAIPRAADSPLRLMLAVTEYGLQSSVKRGENRGRQLRHQAVTRWLQAAVRIPRDKSDALDFRTSIPLEAAWERSRLHLAAFLQDDRGTIHAAGSTMLQ